MDRYEILLLTIPELTKDEESSLEDQLEKFLNNHKGSILSFDRWGKYRLAYPVRNNDYGVYFLMRFEVDNETNFLKELRNMFYIKFNDMVMRHLVTHLKKDQSLEYKKPPSLEDIPKKHIGMFDKGEMRPKSARFDKPSERKPEVIKEETPKIASEAPEKQEPVFAQEVVKQEVIQDVPTQDQDEQAAEKPTEKPSLEARDRQDEQAEERIETVTETKEAE